MVVPGGGDVHEHGGSKGGQVLQVPHYRTRSGQVEVESRRRDFCDSGFGLYRQFGGVCGGINVSKGEVVPIDAKMKLCC